MYVSINLPCARLLLIAPAIAMLSACAGQHTTHRFLTSFDGMRPIKGLIDDLIYQAFARLSI